MLRVSPAYIRVRDTAGREGMQRTYFEGAECAADLVMSGFPVEGLTPPGAVIEFKAVGTSLEIVFLADYAALKGSTESEVCSLRNADAETDLDVIARSGYHVVRRVENPQEVEAFTEELSEREPRLPE